MQLFEKFPKQQKSDLKFILTDIDDTLTFQGRLPAPAYTAMENLEKAGRMVIPVTGRPAGWCDHIARMWPVAGIVGENGAFSFAYDKQHKKMTRFYWKTEQERDEDRNKLACIKEAILKNIPGCRVSLDQPYREADLAIDFCEDVPRLSWTDIKRIVSCIRQAGAKAAVSSIHVNGWFGDYDKLSMTKYFFEQYFNCSPDAMQNTSLFIGDSPNDCSMFAFFPHSVGVSNVLDFPDKLTVEPAWITANPGGFGFAEMVDILLNTRSFD